MGNRKGEIRKRVTQSKIPENASRICRRQFFHLSHYPKPFVLPFFHALNSMQNIHPSLQLRWFKKKRFFSPFLGILFKDIPSLPILFSSFTLFHFLPFPQIKFLLNGTILFPLLSILCFLKIRTWVYYNTVGSTQQECQVNLFGVF